MVAVAKLNILKTTVFDTLKKINFILKCIMLNKTYVFKTCKQLRCPSTSDQLTQTSTLFVIPAAETTTPGVSRGPPKPRRSGVFWSCVCVAGSGRGTGGRSQEIEAVEIEAVEVTSFRSSGTQDPYRGRPLPTPCRAPGRGILGLTPAFG